MSGRSHSHERRMQEPVHIISVGAFGRAVAERLRAIRPDALETRADSDVTAMDPTAWPDARVNIIAAWRPVIECCELLDRVACERRCPFVPLIADATTLSLGPVVVPGGGSCWGCWFRRWKQYAAGLDGRAPLWEYYAAHPAAGPRGYLQPFAVIGASRLSGTIDALDNGDEIGGSLWQIDIMTRAIAVSTVVGVHDCPRCGLGRPPETRSFAEMHHALADLWQDENGKRE